MSKNVDYNIITSTMQTIQTMQATKPSVNGVGKRDQKQKEEDEVIINFWHVSKYTNQDIAKDPSKYLDTYILMARSCI